MDGLIVLAAVALILTPILLVLVLVKLATVQREVELMREQLPLAPMKQRPARARDMAPPTPRAPPHEPPSAPAGAGTPPPRVATPPPPQAPAPLPIPAPASPTPKAAETPAETAEVPLAFRSGSSSLRRPAGPETERLESVIGKRWLVRIGAVVLLLGIGFLYQYSRNRGWVSDDLEIILGGLLGVALWVSGEHFRHRGYDALAQGFAGCGSAVLYLTLWAAHYLFDVIPSAPLAFVGMIAVTAVTVVLAVRHGSPALAVLAQIGGFLTPFLIGEFQGTDHRLLFSYVILLDVGFLALAAWRSWGILPQVAWASSMLVMIAWQFSGIHDRWVSASWVTALAVLFVVGLPLGALLRRAAQPRSVPVLLALNAGVWLVFAWASLHREYRSSLGALVAAMGALHIGLSQIERLRSVPQETASRLRLALDKSFRDTSLTIGLSLVTLAVPFVLKANGITLAWAVEGLLLAILGERLRSPLLRVGGLMAFTLAVARVLLLHLRFASLRYSWWQPQDLAPFLNPEFLSSLGVCAAGFAAAGLARSWRGGYGLAATLLTLGVLAREASIWIEGTWGARPDLDQILALEPALVAAVGAVALAWAARWRPRPLWAITALILVGAAILGFFRLLDWIQASPDLRYLLNGRFAALALIAICVIALRFLVGAHPSLRRLWWSGFGVITVALPVALLSVEGFRYFGRLDTAGIHGGHAALSVTWAAYGTLLLVLGIIRRSRGLRLLALGLLAVTLVKLALVDLSTLEELYRIVSFIVLGALLMGGAWLYHRFETRMFPTEDEDS